jgi:hypothetical protein
MADLMKESKQYRVDTETQVVELIENAKDESSGVVTYKTNFKSTKKDGEYYIVEITEKYDL